MAENIVLESSDNEEGYAPNTFFQKFLERSGNICFGYYDNQSSKNLLAVKLSGQDKIGDFFCQLFR